MVYLNKSEGVLKCKVLINYRMHSIISLIAFIMFVNIHTCLTTTVEDSSAAADHRYLHHINQEDLQLDQIAHLIATSSPSQLLPLKNDSRNSSTSVDVLDSLISTHKEPELDATDRINSEPTKSNQSLSDSAIKLAATEATISTTPNSIEEDNLQNSLAAHLIDYATTLSSMDFQSLAGLDNNAHKGFTHRRLTDSPPTPNPQVQNHSSITVSTIAPTTLAPSSAEVLHVSETKPSHYGSESNFDKKPVVSTETSLLGRSRTQMSNIFSSTTTGKPEISVRKDNKFTSTTNQQQRDPVKTSVSHTTLADLLYIISHLKLANSNELNKHNLPSLDKPKPRGNQLNMNQLRLNDAAPFLRATESPVAWHGGPHSNLRRSNLPYGATRASQSVNSIPDPAVVSQDVGHLPGKTGLVRNKVDQLAKKEDKYMTNDNYYSPAKSTRYPMLSPYSVNFDSGQLFHNYPMTVHNGNHQPADHSPTTADKLKAFLQGQEYNLETDHNQQQQQSIDDVARQINSFTKLMESSSRNHVSKPEAKPVNVSPTRNDDLDYESDSKRNEGPAANRTSAALDSATNKISYDFANKASAAGVKQGDSNEQKGATGGNTARDKLENSLKYKDDAGLGNQKSKLDDPSENAFFDGGDKLAQMGSLAANQPNIAPLLLNGLNYPSYMYKPALSLPQPLTIGELASRHGVPFRLRSPMGADNSIHLNPALFSNQNKLAQESSQAEDLVYMPYNNGNNRLSEVGSLKFDDELKKNLAMKTIEAITRDPELSTRLFDNLYNLNQATAISPTWQKLYPSTLPFGDSDTGGNSPNQLYPHTSPSNAPTMPLNMMLPMASMQEPPILSNPPHSKENISSPINLMAQDLSYRWALSRMPDLIPIPLAATVPGYLIRLPNGQILAAALTNSFSIQGIQKGPLAPSYKHFLNQRLKSLIKTPSSQKPMTNANHITADSDISQITIPPPKFFNPKPNGNTNKVKQADKTGLFSRGVLSQLSFKANQRSTTRAPLSSNNNRNKDKSTRTKVIKFTSPLVQAAESSPLAYLDADFSNLPVASLNDPVFSFADENQLIDTSEASLQPPSPPLILNPDTTLDAFHNDNRSAIIKTKLNQLMSLKNLFGDELFHSKAKKRRSKSPAFSFFIVPIHGLE